MGGLIPPMLLDAPIVPDLYGLALSACIHGGLHMEFGVANGSSLRKIRKLLRSDIPLFGFDCFTGLPEEWNGFKTGSFATPYRVKLPNTELVEGDFADTAPAFAERHSEHVSFIHIDCDLYSSTKTVLDAFSAQIVPGTVILFDELFGYAGYEVHEWRALCESGLRYDAIGRWNAYRAAVRIR